MSQDDDRTTRDAGAQPRGAAEWVTLACACLVLAVLVGLILSQKGEEDTPPSPIARVEAVEAVADGRFVAHVVVANAGGATAANVQVSAELTIDGETSAADQTIDFLAGSDDEQLQFYFDDDPAGGELVVRVTSFGLP